LRTIAEYRKAMEKSIRVQPKRLPMSSRYAASVVSQNMRWVQVSRNEFSNPSRRASLRWTTITRWTFRCWHNPSRNRVKIYCKLPTSTSGHLIAVSPTTIPTRRRSPKAALRVNRRRLGKRRTALPPRKRGTCVSLPSGYHNPISDAGMIRCSYFSHHVTDRRALASPAIEESRHIRSHAF
jgi:hypothetical protein